MGIFEEFQATRLGRRSYAWRLTRLDPFTLSMENTYLDKANEGLAFMYGGFLFTIVMGQAILLRATNWYHAVNPGTSVADYVLNVLLILVSLAMHFVACVAVGSDLQLRWHRYLCRRLLLDEVSRREERKREPKDCCGNPIEPDSVA